MTTEASGNAALGVALASYRSRDWRRFVNGPDSALLEDLYVPMLASAVRYDRSCAYFSSSVLSAAARGFAGLIANLEALGDAAPRPAVRLFVNEELDPDDARALTETGDLAKLEEKLKRRFRQPQDALERARLQMLAWLVQKGLLEVKVGVMRSGHGIVHAKFGLATDRDGDAVVFSGSSNETAQGLRGNYEQVEVSTSYGDPDRHDWHREQFELFWSDKHPAVHTVSLPEALRQQLVRLAPRRKPEREPPTAVARQRAAMLWRFVAEAAYLPNGEEASDQTALVKLWPHQRRVVVEAAAAWPDGRLLCDEVGMGKTIEAILALRRLLAGRGVSRVLILPPAGLLGQWQGELREKGGLVFPRLDGQTRLIWPDGRQESVLDLAAALRQPCLIASRELLRLDQHRAALVKAEPWDLVLLDEAHAARRREQEEGESNSANLLLGLLRELQLKLKARSLMLLSATPMQINPWEPWDLLAVLGEGGKWMAEFARVRDYYDAIAKVSAGHCDLNSARRAALLISSDPDFPPYSGIRASGSGSASNAVVQKLQAAPPTGRPKVVKWLRDGSPLSRRMHRNTRSTLRHYYELGLLPSPPPKRDIRDVHFDYEVDAERGVYKSVGRYIDKRFAELEREKPGKGFVMTVYRRRASSSLWALEKSLGRRAEGLNRVAQGYVVNEEAEDEAAEARELAEAAGADERVKVTAAYPSDPAVARAELHEVNGLLRQPQALGGQDSKLNQLYDRLREVAEEGRAVLIFSEYGDTMVYLRNKLQPHYREALGCYSGKGGQRWVGGEWKTVTKDAITAALERGELKVLVCTDAASEGLNLQAASAVVNYDLPWNPSRVEQRIGRADRIGQRRSEVRVVNFFLRESVDERVYQVLRDRCGVFVQFVGPMQPVLALARRMLLGTERVDLAALDAEARRLAQDALAEETYVESDADASAVPPAPLTLADVETALGTLTGDFGPKAQRAAKSRVWTLKVTGQKAVRLSALVAELEHDPSLLPLTPLAGPIQALADQLAQAGERLPLVVGSHQKGAFRSSVAYWVAGGVVQPVESFAELRRLVEAWDGSFASERDWVAALAKAKSAAAAEVDRGEKRAVERVEAGLLRQVEAARERLLLELGRYLACLDGSSDLNTTLRRLVAVSGPNSQRLQRAVERLTGQPDLFPTWPPSLVQDFLAYANHLNGFQRQARQAGSEVDAALNDPRWVAA